MPNYSQRRVGRGFPVGKMLAALSVLLWLSLLICSIAYANGLKDIKGNWAAPEIEKALSTGYVKGYPDGSFRPNGGVTRAEFVAMVDSAFQVAAGQGKNSFKDVRSKDWFAKDVQSALAAGFVSGYPDGTFRPQQAVNRQEAASMMAKLLNLNGGENLNFFDANQIDNWAKPSIAGLLAKGVMTGYPGNTFCPKKVIDRAEAVVMINKALALPSLTPATTQLQVTEDMVNIRSGPGTNNPIIGHAQKGDILQAKAESSDNWYQIYYQGGVGWITGQYVQIYQAAPPSSQSPPASPSSPSTPSTPANPGGTGQSGVNQATLDVQVKQDSTGTTVDITGAQGAYQYQEETNPQRLLVTVPGITAVQNPSEIDAPAGGLDKIITTFPVAAPGIVTSGATTGITTSGSAPGTATSVTASGTAQVEISFVALPAPLTYRVTQGGPGELLITLPPQIYQVQATPISDFVAVSLSGTAPLSFVSTGSSTQLAFDITGSALNSSLQSWQRQVNALGVSSVKISQYQPNVIRLSAQVSPDVFYTSGTEAGGTQLNLWLQEPAAKKELLAKPASGTLYYGFDASPYPGDNVVQAWWNGSPFCYTSFYLGPTAYHSDASFMNERQTLVNQGWGLMPVYVGRQADSEHLDTPTGLADADEAVNLAVDAGFSRNTTIYLDIETGKPLTGNYMNYVTTWAGEVKGKGYGVGIYCNTKTADQIRSALPGAAFWVAHYTGDSLPVSALSPADTGVSYAGSWQFTGDTSLTYGGYPIAVDLDVSTYHDPSTAPGNVPLGNISMW
ncbi:MAG: S-layer homology domain-containing protein [Thermacetogeniaceae bacterium]